MEALYDVIENEMQDVEDTKSEEPAEPETAEATIDTAIVPENPAQDEVDYEALIESDVAALKAEFPELKGISDITDLNNPLRYAALRDLGLTPSEAYRATAKRSVKDTRSHLVSARGKSAVSPIGMMSQLELATARELFPTKSDSELQRLYKKVSK